MDWWMDTWMDGWVDGWIEWMYCIFTNIAPRGLFHFEDFKCSAY